MGAPRVLFITNYPSPYRVDFFNLLGRQVELTVSFTDGPEAQRHRSREWFHTDYDQFRAVFLKDPVRVGRFTLFRDILPLLRERFDHIILGGYASPTCMLAIEYLRLHRIPYYMEADGGLIQDDPFWKRRVKCHFIRGAYAYFGTGRTTADYFIRYGAKRERIYEYPFTSQWQADQDDAASFVSQEQTALRAKLGIGEQKVVLAVGQFIPRKGFDVLMRAAVHLPEDTGVYIVGGTPTPDYLRMKEEMGLERVHFVGFKTKDKLAEYYQAADVFAMPTREDVWGLVVNEALSYGVPVVSTDRCVAALELVRDGENGYIVPAEDPMCLEDRLRAILAQPAGTFSDSARSSVKGYTLENMVARHVELFDILAKKRART